MQLDMPVSHCPDTWKHPAPMTSGRNATFLFFYLNDTVSGVPEVMEGSWEVCGASDVRESFSGLISVAPYLFMFLR